MSRRVIVVCNRPTGRRRQGGSARQNYLFSLLLKRRHLCALGAIWRDFSGPSRRPRGKPQPIGGRAGCWRGGYQSSQTGARCARPGQSRGSLAG